MFNAMREEVKVKLKKRKVHLTKDEEKTLAERSNNRGERAK